MNIYIGNLDFKVDELKLRDAFEAYGTVSEVKIIADKYSGRSKGFGFIVMENDVEANAAIKGLNGTSINDRQVVVNEAKPKKSY